MSTADHVRALRAELDDPHELVARLALNEGHHPIRQAGGVLIRCPWHPDRTPSCSVRVARDGTIAVRCHGCGQTGDALSLVAVAASLDIRREFRDVLRRAAEIAGRWDIAGELLGGRALRVPTLPRRIVPAAPERTYPPAESVAALLAACVPVTDDAEAATTLEARGLDPEWIADTGLALALRQRETEIPAWARYRGRSWVETGHRLILPVVDAEGAIRSVRAWRGGHGESPKRLPPAGHKAAGLVLADAFTVAMLRGTYHPRRIIIVEGEPDFLTACSRTWGHVLAARIGIGSGAWSDALAAKIPDGADVAVWTDADPAGDAYAREVAASLRGRCRVVRACAEEVAA